MTSQRPKVALWFRYGPAEHSELFHALPAVVKGLAEQAEVHYFGLKSARPVPPLIQRHAAVHELPFKVDRRKGFDKVLKTLLWILAVPFMARKANRLGIDLVYMDENVPFTAWLATRFFHGGVAMTIADFFADIYAEKHVLLRPMALLSSAADRRAWPRLDLVFTRARSTASFLADRGVDAARIVPVYDPCDRTVYRPVDRAEARRALDIPERALVLVHHGILHPNKGNDRILKALPPLCERFPDLLYLLVGDGPEKQRLQRLAKDLHLEHHVRFTGWLPELEEVNRALNAGDIGLVMRTGARNDDFHMTGALVHAMAAGLPILAASLAGVREVVQEGDAGLLFDPGDMATFQTQLARFLEDDILRASCGQRALALAEEHFDMERVTGQTVRALLDTILRSRRA